MARHPHEPWPIAASLRLYRLLLWLYPAAFRRAWGADMAQVFGDLCAQAWRQRGLLALWTATLADLAASLPREHLARATRRHGRSQRRPLPVPARALPPHITIGSGQHPGQRSGAPTVQVYHALRRRIRRLLWRSHQPRRERSMAHPDRFDKFTGRARTVLSLAQVEAQRLNHNYMGTEHLLLGLIAEGDGVAARVLRGLGIQLATVRAAVEHIIGRGDRIVLGEIGLTPRAKKVIELAVDEARRLNHHYIGTEHLLLGLVREGEGIAAGVLESQGARLERVREETLRVLNETPPGEASPAMDEPELVPVGGLPADQGAHLTQRAQHMLRLAQSEALHLNHHYIGTEHLLLGLLAAGEGLGLRMLRRLGVEPGQARAAVEQVAGPGDRVILGDIGLTPRARTIIELAADEARRLDQVSTSTGHLLLGIIREGDGIAGGVLTSKGVALGPARVALLALLAEMGAHEDDADAPPENIT